nr:hypothetical protein [Bacillus cereus]
MLDHTPDWIKRKYKQALQEKYEQHHNNVYGQFQSYMLLIDAMVNKGEDFTKILPPTLEEAMKQQTGNESDSTSNNQEQYDKTEWWSEQKAEEEA